MKYRVLRPHEGDRMYQKGDVREGNEAELRHLVPTTLEPMEGDKAKKPAAEKAEGDFLNKAEGPMANKAEMPAAKPEVAPRRSR